MILITAELHRSGGHDNTRGRYSHRRLARPCLRCEIPFQSNERPFAMSVQSMSRLRHEEIKPKIGSRILNP